MEQYSSKVMDSGKLVIKRAKREKKKKTGKNTKENSDKKTNYDFKKLSNKVTCQGMPH